MPAERSVSHDIRAGRIAHRPDAIIGALAERQFALVAGWQLRDLGVGRGAITHRVAERRLRLVHRGVYAVGHRLLSLHGLWMAAVLRGGRDAKLSHRSAAGLRELVDARAGLIHVTVTSARRPEPGIVWHRDTLRPDECEPWAGIPATGLFRTMLDLAADSSLETVRSAFSRIGQRRLSDQITLGTLFERHRGHRGMAKLRAIKAEGFESARIRSDLELEFKAFLRRQGLPLPDMNGLVEIGDGSTLEVDCVWRDRRLAIELDSRTHHANDLAFERDRERDLALLAIGWRSGRITHIRLRDHAAELARTLRQILG